MSDESALTSSPKHQYEATEGTIPTPHGMHEPRVVAHTVVHPDENTDLMMMTEIADGVFVQWGECRKCNKRVADCKCKGGPVEAHFMAPWRAARFQHSFDERPDPDYKLIPKLVTWLRERGYTVAKKGEKRASTGSDDLFVKLFAAISECEAPAGTQVDDVLESFQDAYSELTGTPRPQWCWECAEDGQQSLATESDENGPLCEGCKGRRDEDALSEVTEDDLEHARETLGSDATDEQVGELAQERVDRDLPEHLKRVQEDTTDVGF